jgi:hypothetical protein
MKMATNNRKTTIFIVCFLFFICVTSKTVMYEIDENGHCDITNGIAIGNGVFRGRTDLKSITIPDSITIIYNGAFYGFMLIPFMDAVD